MPSQKRTFSLPAEQAGDIDTLFASGAVPASLLQSAVRSCANFINILTVR